MHVTKTLQIYIGLVLTLVKVTKTESLHDLLKTVGLKLNFKTKIIISKYDFHTYSCITKPKYPIFIILNNLVVG